MMNPAEFANIAKAEADFWWYRGMRRIMFALLDREARRRPFRHALEAGCGTGHFARVVSDRYGVPVTAVDLGWEGMQYGRLLGVPSLAQADIAALPFPDGAFDLVLSMDVIVHFPRGTEDRPMAELTRVLEPGGLLAVRASALDILRSRHSEFAQERQRFTRRRLMALAERHGIQVLRCTYANALLVPVALAKFRLWEPLTSAAPASGVQPVSPWLDRLLYAPLHAEAAWLGAGGGFPAGQSLILLGRRR
ncbi:MAG: class I SAM-dependent methyltransferase [Bryobacterales bacterium]|nr:class I SAM-dependent methyltransferase [Bryobacterales bacterium]